MANWRDSVDKTLKEHLELQIKEASKYSEAYEKAKNKGQAQLWISISNLSREIFNLELKLKFLEGALKDIASELKNLREQNEKSKQIEPILSDLNIQSDIPDIKIEESSNKQPKEKKPKEKKARITKKPRQKKISSKRTKKEKPKKR